MWSFPRFSTDIFGTPGTSDTRFEREYSCYPVSFAGRETLEQGNKILLPQSALNTLARMNVTWPMLFEISNPELNRQTHSGVLEFSAEEGTCYMPYWMMKNLVLSEGDLVRIVNTSLPKGTYVKLQPVTKDFLDISDHRAVLEHCLRNFATLTVGDNIVIQHNEKSYEIEIVECKPSHAVSIIETDVQVDFAPPKDYVEPPPPPKNNQAKKKTPTRSPVTPVPEATSDTFKVFGGAGARLDGRQPNKDAASSSTARPDLSYAGTSSSDSWCPKSDVEEDFEMTEPWTSKLRLVGGVRVSCMEYEETVNEGRLPGVVGKAKTANKKRTITPNNEKQFSLFGGVGRRAD